MKSFLTALCLVLAVVGAHGKAFAKDSNTQITAKSVQVDKSKSLVNINKADANTLIYYLKGIGEVKAGAIVAYRKENGSFKNTDELLKVTGIGEATFAGLKKNVSTTRGEVTAPKVATSGKKTTTSKSSTKLKASRVVEKEKPSQSADSKSKTSKLFPSKDAKEKKTAKAIDKSESPTTAKKNTTSKESKSKKSTKKSIDCKASANKSNKACKSTSKKPKSVVKDSKSSKKTTKDKVTKSKTKNKKKDEKKK